MIHGWGSEQVPVACIPQLAVESGGRGVASRLPSRPCPEQRDGAASRLRPAELRIHCRELLIAAVLSLLCRLRHE
jgi:hypothetical protein